MKEISYTILYKCEGQDGWKVINEYGPFNTIEPARELLARYQRLEQLARNSRGESIVPLEFVLAKRICEINYELI